MSSGSRRHTEHGWFVLRPRPVHSRLVGAGMNDCCLLAVGSRHVERNAGDAIRLTVPATTAAVRIARVGAAGLGTRLGFTFAEVEELRLAVGEAAASLCEENGDQVLDVTYDIDRDGLRVTLAIDADRSSDGGAAPRTGISALAAAVLDTVVDEWHEDPDGGRVVLRKTPADHDHPDDD